jgi:hypothetical protein
VSKRGFLVSFSNAAPEPLGLDRVRNWAEDLSHEAARKGWGTVEDADVAIDRVSVIASSARTLESLAGAVKRSLRHHNLLGIAVVSKLPDAMDTAE